MAIDSSTASLDRELVWEEQNAATVLAYIRPEAETELRGVLASIGAEVGSTGQPFAQSTSIHYARFVLIPSDRNHDGETIGPSLVYLADFDGPRDAHLEEIARIGAAVFDRVSPFCREPIPGTHAGRRRWLDDHVIPHATSYVNTIGRTVPLILRQARLRDEVDRFLSDTKLNREDPNEVTRRIREFVSGQDRLRWALAPPPSERPWLFRRTLARVIIIAIAVPVLIVLLPILIAWTLLVRLRETRDPGDPPRPDPAHVVELAAAEDHSLHNQFSALGFVKPGRFRLMTATVILWIGRIGTRYFFDREDLAGVKTIHFARWIFIDGKRRMLFASNYDGSLENYMGDFIDIVAWGLNAIFSNGKDYPRTRWLILDGAWNEGSFKRHIRNRQIPTQVWYCAYPNLSAVKIADNSRLHAALHGAVNAGTPIDWLWLLRQNLGRPAAVPAVLERNDMQGLIARGHSQHRSACFVLLTFDGAEEGATSARRWLGDIVGRVTDGTSSRNQRDLHIAFTHQGLARLDCPADILAGFSDEFCAGMTTPHRQRILGDDGANAPSSWEWGDPSRPIDALLLLYARSDVELEAMYDSERDQCSRHGISCMRLDTQWIEGGREHFGFQDGIMNPPMEGLGGKTDSGPIVKAGEFVLGYQNEYGRFTSRPIVAPGLDPAHLLLRDVEGTGGADFGRNGTYLVFRQLRQDVYGFWDFAERAAARFFGTDTPDHRTWIASKLVGRWPSGAPLTLTPDRDDPTLASAKDFLYQRQDALGMRCPIGAHIRRTNPRDSLEPRPGSQDSLAVNRRHQILRRGRSYGPACPIPDVGASVLEHRDAMLDRGLHFICLNANIARQFEFVQASWVNNPQFGNLSDDVDPLIGRRGRFSTNGPSNGTFTIPQGCAPIRLRQMPNFVRVRGGAYFFMPSLSALRFLAQFRTSNAS